MTDDQRFMDADGRPLSYLQAGATGEVTIPPDSFSALRVVLAALDADDTTMLEVLQQRPALPLLSGLTSLVIALGEQLYGDKLRECLDAWALVSADPAAEAFREHRRSS